MLFCFFSLFFWTCYFNEIVIEELKKKNVERGQNFVDLPVSQFLASFFSLTLLMETIDTHPDDDRIAK
jgi:hypothetical protein